MRREADELDLRIIRNYIDSFNQHPLNYDARNTCEEVLSTIYSLKGILEDLESYLKELN